MGKGQAPDSEGRNIHGKIDIRILWSGDGGKSVAETPSACGNYRSGWSPTIRPS